MSKYKVGDKVVFTITETIEKEYNKFYSLNDTFCLRKESIDDYTELLSKYTEPLKAKISRQAAEITRLLAENKELKEDFEKSKRVNLNMGRRAGQNEAWEMARKIAVFPKDGGYGGSKLIEIFNTALIDEIFNLTYQEAAAKVAEWEKGRDEIKVGDIVKTKCDTSFEFCVTDIDCNGYLYGIGGYGETYSDKNPKDWEKTGRHIDIDSFLKQIGGNGNER